MHFLVIDDRFRVPIFVFLELDPRGSDAGPVGAVRAVSLEFAAAQLNGAPRRSADFVRPQSTIGQDPERPDRYVEFSSDRHVRAAGYTLIEPRYVGPSWETYLNVFRPEGEKHFKLPAARPVGSECRWLVARFRGVGTATTHHQGLVPPNCRGSEGHALMPIPPIAPPAQPSPPGLLRLGSRSRPTRRHDRLVHQEARIAVERVLRSVVPVGEIAGAVITAAVLDDLRSCRYRGPRPGGGIAVRPLMSRCSLAARRPNRPGWLAWPGNASSGSRLASATS